MANHTLCILYSTLFDSSRHIYLSLQFTHVRLYPSSLFKMLFSFQRTGNFPPSVFLIQTPLSYLKPLHRRTMMSFFSLFLSVTFSHPFFCHNGQCTHWQAFPGVWVHAPGICTILNVQTIWYVGIIFLSKPCQRHLRYNSLSNFICQEGLRHSPFKTNRQVAFFILLCLLERPDSVLLLSTFFFQQMSLSTQSASFSPSGKQVRYSN